MLDYNIKKPMQIITIKALDVEMWLKKLNPSKSVDPDGVHPWTLKEAHLELAPLLTYSKSLWISKHFLKVGKMPILCQSTRIEVG